MHIIYEDQISLITETLTPIMTITALLNDEVYCIRTPVKR
jgi:hypothetical protein